MSEFDEQRREHGWSYPDEEPNDSDGRKNADSDGITATEDLDVIALWDELNVNNDPVSSTQLAIMVEVSSQTNVSETRSRQMAIELIQHERVRDVTKETLSKDAPDWHGKYIPAEW